MTYEEAVEIVQRSTGQPLLKSLKAINGSSLTIHDDEVVVAFETLRDAFVDLDAFIAFIFAD